MFDKPLRLVLVLATLLLTACEGKVLENVRKVTYPPDFNYISRDKLTGIMHQFAWYTELLDRNLRDTANVTDDQRLSSIDILSKMEKLSLQLGSENLSSTHDIVSMNIDQFRNSIIQARTGLQQDPPNYYLAGSVSAFCLNCHQITRK